MMRKYTVVVQRDTEPETLALFNYESNKSHTVEQVKNILDDALTKWAEQTPEGAEAYADSVEDFNIGDLFNWDDTVFAVGHMVRKELEDWGIFNPSLEEQDREVLCNGDWHYDSHLMHPDEKD